ncbi:MAG: hypothetical protein KAT05_06690 [Spirochaetes bacterium]|nr:hypothetical protein [Spirochaetota bacterium]
MKLVVFVSLIFVLLLTPVAFCTSVDDYMHEFGNEGETCTVVDTFVYNQKDPKWWDDNYYSETVPVFYNCCDNDDCTVIAIDIKNKELLYDDSFKELINLNYIKYSLSVGNLSTTYFVNKGLNSCVFHGRKKLSKESLNLAADVTEDVARLQKSKHSSQVIQMIHTAKSLNIISPFSAVDFGISRICSYNNKKLEKAVSRLATCNLYLENIRNNYARTGYVEELDNCFVQAKIDLEDYHEDYIAKGKYHVDKTANIISYFFHGIYSVINFLLNNSGNINLNLSIEKTEYELAEDISKSIENKQVYLHNPKTEEIFDKYTLRIIWKSIEYDLKYYPLKNNLSSLKYKTPNILEIYTNDIFYEPNYNISEGISLLNEADEELKKCDNLYKQHKYNTAIFCIDEITPYHNNAELIILKESNVERTFDIRWYYLFATVIIILVIGKNIFKDLTQYRTL